MRITPLAIGMPLGSLRSDAWPCYYSMSFNLTTAAQAHILPSFYGPWLIMSR